MQECVCQSVCLCLIILCLRMNDMIVYCVLCLIKDQQNQAATCGTHVILSNRSARYVPHII